MGQVLQAGQGQIPSRQAQIKAGHPEGGLLGDDQQGLRVGRARRRDPRPGDPRRRRRGRRRRRHGVDVAGAVPAARRALRLPHGRRQGARRDGPRRPDQPVQRQADVRRGDRGRRRARDDAPRPRPLGAALARARDRRDRRGPHGRRDRPRDGQGREGRHGRRGRRGPAPRHLARGARQAARPDRQGGLAHRRQLAGRQRRRRRARARQRRVGRARTARRSLAEIVAQARGRRRLRLPRPHARDRGRRRRSTRPACSRTTSTCGRSTRRSPR